MKRTRLIHGSRKPGDSPLLANDPHRQTDRDPWRTRWGMVSLATLLVLGVAAQALRHFGELWWLIPLAPVAFAAVTLYFKLGMRSARRKLGVELRQISQVEQESAASSRGFEVRRTFSPAWPILLTAIFGVALILAAFFRSYPFLVVASIFLVPLLVLAWWRAVRQAGGVLLTLGSSGLRIGETEIPWRNVENLRIRHAPRMSHYFLVIDLRDPLPPRGWMARINSALSRGESDRYLEVSLRNSSIPNEAVFLTARRYWSDVVGRDHAFEALRIELGSARRPFSLRPPAEKRRIIIWLCIYFLGLLLAVHGTRAAFLGSAAWTGTRGWLALAMTAWFAYRLWRGNFLDSVRSPQRPVANLSTYLVLLGLLYGTTLLAVGSSLPDIWTRFSGSPREFTATLHKDQRRNDRRCRTRITGELFVGRFKNHYCARWTEYAALPGSGPMLVKVRESWFGMHIERIDPVDPEFHR